jgi:transposase
VCCCKKKDQSEQGLGRSCGGFSTKIHAVCDALGNPLDFIITGGEVADCTQFRELTKNLKFDFVLADKGYDSNEIVESITNTGAKAVIPPRKNRIIQRKYDKHIYKERHKIECLFGFLKHYRRLFARFDKTKKNFLSFIYFVSTLQWLK